MGEDEAASDRTVWSRRIKAERTARGWSQPRAVEALRAHAERPLPSNASLLRSWRRWEAGHVEPDAYYKALIARVFGTAMGAIFPRPDDTALVAATGMDTPEILARLRASDVSPDVLEALRLTAIRLGTAYSHTPAEQMIVEGRRWLARLTALLHRRLTLAQHREVLQLAGRVALLVGCVEYDLDRAAQAEATRRAALSLGQEAGSAAVVGWAYEMRSWYDLTQGRYADAIAAARAGREAVGAADSVAVQLAAHTAKAWARIGDRRQVELAIEDGRAILEAMPYPDDPDDHFVIDPAKFDFYTMDVYRHANANDLAATYAEEVIRSSTRADGTVAKPMRAAEAHITLGVVAARSGSVETAIAHGQQALAGERRSVPSLRLHASELAQVLTDRYGRMRSVVDYVDQVRALSSGTGPRGRG